MADGIGHFLRTRRGRVNPEDLGIVSYGRRRVPGLRREELAQAAGISVDYYVRLEQGRCPTVSDSVLDAIARVLRLDPVERQHLGNLARQRPGAVGTVTPRPRRAATATASDRQTVRPGLRRLLSLLTEVPAFILGRRMDILAWNELADAVAAFGAMAPDERNAARHTFLDPAARDFYSDWSTVAGETVAYLRLDAGRHPDDPRLAALVGELALRDDTFRQLWARHEVREKTHGVKRIRHPIVGELVFGYETLAPPGDDDQLLVTYTVEAGSPTQERLRLLASWTATEAMPADGTSTKSGPSGIRTATEGL